MNSESMKSVSEALKRLARNQEVKKYILQHPEVYGLVLRGARKFIGGETREECLNEVARLNQLGIATTIDFCGENTISQVQVAEATAEFLR